MTHRGLSGSWRNSALVEQSSEFGLQRMNADQSRRGRLLTRRKIKSDSAHGVTRARARSSFRFARPICLPTSRIHRLTTASKGGGQAGLE